MDSNQSILQNSPLTTNSKLSAINFYQQHHSSNLPLHPNSLTGIAGKLFSIICEIKKPNKKYDANKLKPYLLKELQAFADSAKEQGHNEETILIGQYIISKSLDIIILDASWGQEAH